MVSPSDEQLFDQEVFGDRIAIDPNQFYVGVGTSATLSSELTHRPGDLGFGFSTGSEVDLTTYKLFEKPEEGALPKL